MFPMSRSRIISGAKSDITADDAFETAMLSTDEERALGVEGFGAAFDFSGADGNFDMMADGGAALFPFVRDGFEFSGEEAVVVGIEFAQKIGGEFGAVNGMAEFDFKRSGDIAEICRKIGFVEIHIHADSEDDIFDFVQFGGHFGKNAADFFAADENVVGPFDFGGKTGFVPDGA